jgi:hypothetical protein
MTAVAVFWGVALGFVNVVPAIPGAAGAGERPFEGTGEFRSGSSVRENAELPVDLRSGSVVRGLAGVTDSLERSREESRGVTELSPVDLAGAIAGVIFE